MPAIVHTAPQVEQGLYPPAGKQFGNKFFICLPDQRPFYLLPSLTGSAPKAYQCGIKPPTFYPSIASSSDDALNIIFDASPSANPFANTMFIRYAFYSSVRGIFSEPSPEQQYDIPATPKKVVISGFFYPRDDAISQDIDTVVVGIQWGVSTDCRCIFSRMATGFDPTNIATAQIVFDSSQADLNQFGFGLVGLAEFVKIPPPCFALERVENRLFYIPSRRRVVFDQAAVTVSRAQLDGTLAFSEFSAGITGTNTHFLSQLQPSDVVQVNLPDNTFRIVIVGYIASDTFAIMTAAWGVADASAVEGTRLFRGEPAARVTLDSPIYLPQFSDSLYRMRLTVNGQFLEEVWDVDGSTVLYLDGDVPASITASSDFFFFSPGDTVLPSGYTNETPFGFPVQFPEGIQFVDAVPLTQTVDEGQLVRGIHLAGEFPYVMLSDTVLQMTVDSGAFSPLPISFRAIAGRIGPVAPRSICLDQSASLGWIGEEGLALGNSGGINTVSHRVNSNQFWKGKRWVDVACLPDLPMVYTRGGDGFVIANMRINARTLTGAFTVTQDSGVVTGVSSLLLTEAKVGDVFTVNGQHRRILTITDDENMTIETWDFPGGVSAATIGAGYWALVSMRPQLAILVFDGLICTSNLIEYQDADGQSVIIGGSNYKGRIFRLLAPNTYTDTPLGSDGDPAAYTCEWRGGWETFPGGEQNGLMRVRMIGANVPSGTADLILTLWSNNLPQRNEADLPAGAFLEKTVSASKILFDQPMPPNFKRFGALGVKFQSDAGLVDGRPMEISRWLAMKNGDGK